MVHKDSTFWSVFPAIFPSPWWWQQDRISSTLMTMDCHAQAPAASAESLTEAMASTQVWLLFKGVSSSAAFIHDFTERQQMPCWIFTVKGHAAQPVQESFIYFLLVPYTVTPTLHEWHRHNAINGKEWCQQQTIAAVSASARHWLCLQKKQLAKHTSPWPVAQTWKMCTSTVSEQHHWNCSMNFGLNIHLMISLEPSSLDLWKETVKFSLFCSDIIWGVLCVRCSNTVNFLLILANEQHGVMSSGHPLPALHILTLSIAKTVSQKPLAFVNAISCVFFFFQPK